VSVYEYLLDAIAQKGAVFLALNDPDKQAGDDAVAFARHAAAAGADAILVGGSFLFTDQLHKTVATIRASVDCPLILFPGASGPAAQISPDFDAILLLSLVSGRNPEYLIGAQVRSALWIDRCNLESIPTAYLLIASDTITSAEFFSGVKPIPRDKPEIAMVHALAAQQLGMKAVYLEAGSGASNPVPDAMIAAVRERVSLPILVGGGIRDPQTARQKLEAGADMVVIGTVIERSLAPSTLRAFSDQIHWRRS